ncbi:dihydrolipoamide acetyltransferase [Pseudonocardia sp. MH-G8]|nr:dihydrolipoamide acetyltransferase [Pseudonocardia sp. MH-G8]
MPRLSDTMEAGVIAAWHKKVGDAVSAGDVVADIETDKAIMELEAYDDGVLERILVAEGESAPIGTPIGVLGDGSGTGPTPAATSAPEPAAPEPAAPEPANAEPAAEPPAPAEVRDARPPASPLARRLARERGVDLQSVQGSGPHGRIIRADIEAAAEEAPAAAPAVAVTAPAPAPADVDEVPLTAMQRIAAARLTQSKQEAPHIYLTRAVDVTDLLALRATLNTTLVAAGGPKVSVNDLVVKAVAAALRAHPEVNVSFAGEVVRRHRGVHVGVAVAVESGLLVPVVRDADRHSVSEIAAQTRDFAARARDRRLRPDEMTGGTFTVSNLGMYGIEQFTAVINPPEAAILAVGAAAEELRPRDGVPVVRSIMRVTLSCDHRVVDGATGAGFLRTLTELLETPLRILA